MKKYALTGLFLFLVAAFFITTAFAYLIKGAHKDVEAKVLKINGRNYLLLIDVCEANGVDWQWDGIARKITLSKDGRGVTLLAGSKYYYTGAKISSLSAPVKMENGA
ncbi:MAG: stalk domain-containing protein, partial [Candidatus Omnitrophota bacterium]|nr:stalk domain-containing protein [Candidatus Omnitrophota bacterium]